MIEVTKQANARTRECFEPLHALDIAHPVKVGYRAKKRQRLVVVPPFRQGVQGHVPVLVHSGVEWRRRHSENVWNTRPYTLLTIRGDARHTNASMQMYPLRSAGCRCS